MAFSSDVTDAAKRSRLAYETSLYAVYGSPGQEGVYRDHVEDAATLADAVLAASKPCRGVLIAEDEFVEVVAFASEAELEAFADGVSRGSDLYGAGCCFVYTLADLDDEWLVKEKKELIRKHLGGGINSNEDVK